MVEYKEVLQRVSEFKERLKDKVMKGNEEIGKKT
jgi:hypothetical protein